MWAKLLAAIIEPSPNSTLEVQNLWNCIFVYSFLNFFDWSTGWCLVGFGSALLKIAIKHFQPIHHSYDKFFWGLTQSPFLYVLPHSPTKLPFNLKKNETNATFSSRALSPYGTVWRQSNSNPKLIHEESFLSPFDICRQVKELIKECFTVKLTRAKLSAKAGNFTCGLHVKRSHTQVTCVTCSLPIKSGKFTRQAPRAEHMRNACSRM